MDRPIIPVPTVDSIAFNLYGTKGLICPLMDARRQQVYTGIYEWENLNMKAFGKAERQADQADRSSLENLKLAVLRSQCVIPVSEVIEDLNARGREVVFLGDGVPVSREALADNMKVPYSFAPAHLSRQRAAAVAALAYSYYEDQGAACMVSADAAGVPAPGPGGAGAQRAQEFFPAAVKRVSGLPENIFPGYQCSVVNP